MFLVLLFASVLLSGTEATFAATTVHKVDVEGNLRVPTVTVLRQLSVSSGSPFDPAKVQADIKKLYALGLFRNVEVTSRETADGLTDVIYRVSEYPYISGFQIEGGGEGLDAQIRDLLKKENLDFLPATPYRPALANKAALLTRDYLRMRKYPDAVARIETEENGNLVLVRLKIQSGPKLEIGRVQFVGNESIPAGDLRKQMQHIRSAPFWAPWSPAGRYVPEELSADLDRLRRYYQSHGFAVVSVGTPKTVARNLKPVAPIGRLQGEKARLEVEIPIVEGPKFRLLSVEVDGDLRGAGEDVRKLIAAIPTPSEYNYGLLEATRQKIADTFGHLGYALARVQLEQSSDSSTLTIRAVYKISTGVPVVVGRISFEGNSRLPDKFIRRELRILEGQVFDLARLDQSIERLNRRGILNELRREDVRLRLDEERNLLDITFRVKEKDRQGIYGTGGTGGIGGGYLGILYTAFNLLHLGEALSFELDGGASQSNMLLNIVGAHFLGSPFNVALSAFNRFTNFNVANLVPGPNDLVSVLRRRTRGVGLSGAYPITTKFQAGLGFEVQRDIVSDQVPTAANTNGSFGRSDVTPFVALDATRGTGPAMRGYRASFSHSWSGSTFLRSLDATSNSAQIAGYWGDPISHGRNSFAFQLKAAEIRSNGTGPLFLERRFFPGDETVRGFRRGALSPWAYSTEAVSPTLQPLGADTLLGLSAEYRVPIQGPVSSVAFFDLGWSHLDPKVASSLGPAGRIVEKSNSLLRASVGGELRLELPMIHQPARLIFSWNPLRLDTLLAGPSPLRLADPSRTIRFALGNLF